MKSYQRIFIFLLLILLFTALASPWAAALWNTVAASDSAQGSSYSFGAVFNRVFMITGGIVFFLCRPLFHIQSLNHLGLKSFRQGYPDLLRGALIALASVITVACLMSWSEVFTPFFRLSPATALERTVKALLTALTVGFLEEIFFRGVIFKGMLEDWKPVAAFILSSFFYAAIHFVRPTEKFSVAGIDPWAGIHYLTDSFQPFLNPMPLLPGLLGLFLIGMALSYAFSRTGSLYLSIGLHAGWVFGLKTIRVYGDFRRGDLGWLFGASEPKLISGVVSWIVILGVGIVIHWMTRKRQDRILSY